LHLLAYHFLGKSVHAACQLGFIQFFVAIGVKLLQHLLGPGFGIKAGKSSAGEAPSLATCSGSPTGLPSRSAPTGSTARTLSSRLALNSAGSSFRVVFWIRILSECPGGKRANCQGQYPDC
jgi:hypothetical protein